MEAHPSRMLAVLRECGALAALLPEVDALFGVPQPPAHHPRDRHRRARRARRSTGPPRTTLTLPARYAVLGHDLGKAASPADDAAAAHRARAAQRAPRAARSPSGCAFPQECRDVARARRALPRRRSHRAAELRPATTARPPGCRSMRCGGPSASTRCVAACAADACSRPGAPQDYAPASALRDALAAVKRVDAGRDRARGGARKERGRPARGCDRKRRCARARLARRCGSAAKRASRCGTRPPSSRWPPRASGSARAAAARCAPASCAIAPWRASSSRIASTIARLFASRSGSRSRCVVRCSSTWRSVSTTKPEVDAVADEAGERADRKRARVPQRIEERRPVVELGKARLRPREMILLLARRAAKRAAIDGIARDERLRRVERLRAHLAGVVDAHEAAPRWRRSSLVRSASGSSAPGTARDDSATPASVRNARSKPMMAVEHRES